MRIVGVLDWEMATVGDPLMDLGGTLSYWVEADDDEFFQCPPVSRRPSRACGPGPSSSSYYCERMGFEITPEQWRFYEVFGLFRLAVIAQQIWYRYFHRQTTNEAYAIFGPAVGYLESRCRTLVSTARPTDPGSMRRGPLMGVVLLVRHGQASFGAEDYDVLSETGWEQSRLLGAWLGERKVTPDAVLHGDMRGTGRPRRG